MFLFGGRGKGEMINFILFFDFVIVLSGFIGFFLGWEVGREDF